jgi:hypothetical protein
MKAVATSAKELYISGRRLDAGFHASEGVKATHFMHRWVNHAHPWSHHDAKTLHNPPAAYSTRSLDTLAGVCVPNGIWIPGRFKRIYVDSPEYGAPYLTGSSIMQANPLEGTKFLSFRFGTNLDGLALHEGMILVTCSGTIGNSVYVNSSFRGTVGSPDLLRIVADADKILPGYLYAFLSSKLGKALIEQKTYGAVIPHIEAHHIVDLPIPRLAPSNEQRIHDLIEQAATLRVEASALLARAQARLLDVCGLPRLTNREALTKGCWRFTMPRSQLGRFALTAWTYNPIMRSLLERIQAQPHADLGELVTQGGIYYGNHFKRISAAPGNGIMLLSQGDVFQVRPEGRWISKQSVINYRYYLPPNLATLVAAHGTMGDNEIFGRCQFSHRNINDRMLTQDILRIVAAPEKIHPGYLFAFLASEYGFQLLRSTACGTKILIFILGLVKRIPIPIISDSLQAEIGSMVYRAYDNRADALLCEEQAQMLLAEALGLET